MINVSPAYSTAINADIRHIVPKVEIYFDGDNNPPTIFQGEGSVTIKMLEEARADNANPLGLVSSNEVELGFDNSNRNFTPTNITSPYYDKLKPNVLVKPYLGLELPDLPFEYIPLGIFRTGDWSSPSSSVEATVTCYDRLYEIGNIDIPLLPVRKNTTIVALFTTLFTAIGLTAQEFNVVGLTQSVAIGWLPKGKVFDALQQLCVAGNCNVSVDRYGVIQVKSNVINSSAVETWTDNNQIFNADNPQNYGSTYSAVNVKYKMPFIRNDDTVLKINSLVVPGGDSVLGPLTFTSGLPVAVISAVILDGSSNITVMDVDAGAWGMTITINNAGASETIVLEVIGQVVDSVISEYKTTVSGATFDRTLTIENDLIQELAVATTYGNQLLTYVSDPLANFFFDARGNPAIEINDVININDVADKIPSVDVIVVRTELDFDGALSGKLKARRR